MNSRPGNKIEYRKSIYLDPNPVIYCPEEFVFFV
jgi:hypothetical protein